MINKVLVVSFATIFSINLYSAEPSAFGAGDLDNPQPYGLSSSEKVVLENKNEIQSIATKTKNQIFQMDSMRERIDGLQSVVENLTRNSHQNKIDLSHIDEKFTSDFNTTTEYQKRLSDIVEKNSLQINELNSSLEQLDKLVKTIEFSFISKDEFNGLVNDFNDFKTLLKKEFKVVKNEKKTRTNWEISKDAEKNFAKKKYSDSINDYKYLIEQKFKPAYAHYMIGEINYIRKNYSEAIAYFKKSADLYSKAKYMPVLMLHTAIAMESTGDIKNAKVFYNAIASSYPNTKEAEISLKNLETVK